MGIFRVLLVIVILFSGYVSVAHGCAETASITTCCDEKACDGCVAPVAVVAAIVMPAIFNKPALEPLPAPVLARDATPFHLRPPDVFA
ncbi:MAG: hypothetical protein ACAH80_06625 [Alphaproteobacteria bacterium]